jgi:hypothetical protein
MTGRHDLTSFGEGYQKQLEKYLEFPKMIDAYGSCSPLLCQAVLVTSEDLVATMKPVGIGMSVAGAFVILLVILLHGCGSSTTEHKTEVQENGGGGGDTGDDVEQQEQHLLTSLLPIKEDSGEEESHAALSTCSFYFLSLSLIASGFPH